MNGEESIKTEYVESTETAETAEAENSGVKRRVIKKPGIIAATVIIALLAAALIFKDTVLTNEALKKIRRSDFAGAKSVSSYIGSAKGDALRGYIDLRLEINREYPRLLAKFDSEKFISWRDKAQEVKDISENASAKLFVEVSKLYDRLGTVCELTDEYETMRPGILEMMDIFEEINRLYAKDGQGNSLPFTIGEETVKVERWESQCDSLGRFSSRVPGGDKIYLLSFLITETRSECDDITKQMDELREKGYGDDDPVRVSTSGHKNFPDIANSSGTSVSVARKEEYEKYMYISVCRALTESLAEYYTGI